MYIKHTMVTYNENDEKEEINTADIVYVIFTNSNNKEEFIVGQVITIYSDAILIDGSKEFEANKQEIYIEKIKFISKYN